MDEKGCTPGMGMEMMKKMMEDQGGFSRPMIQR